MSGFSPRVEIYCKIGCDQFPSPPWCIEHGEPARQATGNEIVEFLMSDAGYVCQETDKGTETIPGDKVIWYLCCNEKVGLLQVDEWHIGWRSGDASSGIVRQFMLELLRRTIITPEQFERLDAEIRFADETFNICYEIGPYLIAKQVQQKGETQA